MITIDCSKAQSIKDKLLVPVADQLGAMPILKSDKFILTSLDDSKTIEKSAALASVLEFIKSKNLQEKVKAIQKKNDNALIIIEYSDRKKKIKEPKKELFFECTHCGFITQYEVELRTHKLIHYI